MFPDKETTNVTMTITESDFGILKRRIDDN